MPSPQLSLTLATFAADDPQDWSHLIDRAVAADRAGLDRLALSDHVAFGTDLSAYADPAKGGVDGGRQPTGPDGLWLEPLTVVSHLTGVTRRVRFATNVLLAALRRPVVLAKAVATIDVLSGSRLDLGVGVGWQAAEYEAAGLSFSSRGAQLDHTLAVCQELWANDEASFDDDRVTFAKIHQQPKPAGGGVPIWVSGTVNRRAMTRLARFGSGWIPWGPDAADLGSSIPRMRVAVAEAGGDATGLDVVGSLPTRFDGSGAIDVAATMHPVPRLAEVGVTDFRSNARFTSYGEELIDQIGSLVAAFRAVSA